MRRMPMFVGLTVLSAAGGDRVVAEKVSPVRALLAKPVERVDWDEVPFDEVVDWLRGLGRRGEHVNVVVRYRAMEGVDEDSPVTLRMEKTSVARVLEEVLDQVSQLEEVTYEGVGNTLRISTASDFERKMHLRVYDVEAFRFELQRFRGAPRIDLTAQGQGSGAAQPRKESVFESSGGKGGDDEDDPADGDERAEWLMDWIRRTVEPASWKANGGRGTMAVVDGQLVVRNSLRVQELLGGAVHLDE